MIRVMMDHCAYPLWNKDGVNYNCISETGIVYDEALEEGINKFQILWIDKFNNLLPTCTIWSEEGYLARKIAGRIKELNPDEEVIYFDETSEEWWVILPYNKGVVIYE